MNLFEIAGKIPGIDVRKQTLGSTEAVSITGPYKLVGYGLKFAIFVGMVSIEQIARFGIRRDGKQCHLVLTQERKYKLSRAEDSQLALLDGYHYAHQVTALGQDVNVGVFDKGFEPKANSSIGRAFGHFAGAIFAKGKVRDTDTNTLLLLGRSAKDRVLVACQWNGQKSPLTVVEQAIRGDVRFASVQDTTLLVAAYGSNAYAALHVDQIARKLGTGEVPTWKTNVLPNEAKIEDFTPSIGNQATLVVSAKLDGRRQAMPANARWSKNGQFSLELVERYATDLPETSAPIVRLTDERVTTVNGNGLDLAELLTVASIDAYGDPATSQGMRRMATDAASGAIWQAAT